MYKLKGSPYGRAVAEGRLRGTKVERINYKIRKREHFMKSVKKMLLGIAFLIIAVIGAVFFVNNSTIGAFIFFPALIIGIIICIDGYLSVD